MDELIYFKNYILAAPEVHVSVRALVNFEAVWGHVPISGLGLDLVGFLAGIFINTIHDGNSILKCIYSQFSEQRKYFTNWRKLYLGLFNSILLGLKMRLLIFRVLDLVKDTQCYVECAFSGWLRRVIGVTCAYIIWSRYER